MKRFKLVEADLRGMANAVLDDLEANREDALLSTVASVLDVRNARLIRARVAELFELPDDDIVGLVSAWIDRRVIAGTEETSLRAEVVHLRRFFSRCEREGLGHVDLNQIE